MQKNGFWSKKVFREIDLFDLMGFFGLDFLLFFWSTVIVSGCATFVLVVTQPQFFFQNGTWYFVEVQAKPKFDHHPDPVVYVSHHDSTVLACTVIILFYLSNLKLT